MVSDHKVKFARMESESQYLNISILIHVVWIPYFNTEPTIKFNTRKFTEFKGHTNRKVIFFLFRLHGAFVLLKGEEEQGILVR